MHNSLPRSLHVLLIALHLSLIVLGFVSLWQESVFDAAASPFVRWLPYLIVACVIYAPLVLMLPAVISANSRLLIWLGIVLLLYFVSYLLQLMEQAPSGWSIAKFANTLALFIAACWAIRLQTRKTPSVAADDDTGSPPEQQH